MENLWSIYRKVKKPPVFICGRVDYRPDSDDKSESPHKWQHTSYQRYSETGEYPSDADEFIAQYGEEGWELVSMTFVPLEQTPTGNFIFNFKRGPIKNS